MAAQPRCRAAPRRAFFGCLALPWLSVLAYNRVHCTALQAECARQNVTLTLFAATMLANGSTVYHTFQMQQGKGTAFDGITVTHLASPTQASGSARNAHMCHT